MKILLFGGTFDPPHNGHISLLSGAYDTVQPEKALIIPACDPPHKASAHAPKELRLAMCKAVLPYVPFAELELCELARQGESYTVDTIHYLQDKYKQAELYFCLGGDMLIYFRKWRNYKELLRAMVLVVQMRGGIHSAEVIQMAHELESEGGTIMFTDTRSLTVSSTLVRELLSAGMPADEYVPREVLDIINKSHLYTKEE